MDKPTAEILNNVDSLEVFIRTNGHALLKFITAIFPSALRQRYDVIDLYQTTVFEAFRRTETFHHIDPERTFFWLQTLARRQVGMALRNERRQKRGGGIVPSGLKEDDVAELLRSYGTTVGTPSQSAIRHETLALVRRALESLPPHLQEALTLRYLQGRSIQDVGQVMGRSERAAATLCFRGLRLLRRKLRMLSPTL